MMKSVIEFANNAGKVFGVCNGFQILCEAKLLPGILLRNANQQYISKNAFLRGLGDEGRPLKIPIAHGEGRYYADENTLDELESNNQVLYKYCDENGKFRDESNPNGSLRNIAGICNTAGNVIGMMPHPERACSEALGNTDGKLVLQALFLNQRETHKTKIAQLANF
jgi:phosphoribosylformylglycinamidine synthase